jgi:trans-aconitate 2-methyltransferase
VSSAALPDWNSQQYLRFSRERTRPAADLAARIPLTNPATVVDLGCGPGNSTRALVERWPAARIIGVDNSPAMLAAARRDLPVCEWIQADIATWTPVAPVDVIFSNASL